MDYKEHMIANFHVAKKAFIEAMRQLTFVVLHILHGLVPCKYTSHEYLIRNKQRVDEKHT